MPLFVGGECRASANWELSIAQATTKKKVSDPANFYNQAFNSHAAVFEVYLVRAKTRLVCFLQILKRKRGWEALRKEVPPLAFVISRND